MTAGTDVTAGVTCGRRRLAQLSVELRYVFRKDRRMHGRAFGAGESNLWWRRRVRLEEGPIKLELPMCLGHSEFIG